MNVLAIETSSTTSSIALVRESHLIASRAFPSAMTLCQTLIPEIRAVLGYLPQGEQLQGIAVSVGPGSFTSLRIGVMTAKALAHQMGIRLVGVPTMEALAWSFVHDVGQTICVIQPAWKSAVYLTMFRAGPHGQLWRLARPVALEPDALLDRLRSTSGSLLLVGEAAIQHECRLLSALRTRAALAPASLSRPHAIWVAQAAWGRIAHPDPEAAFRLRPLYVVPSQAERTAGIDLGLSGAEDLG